MLIWYYKVPKSIIKGYRNVLREKLQFLTVFFAVVFLSIETFFIPGGFRAISRTFNMPSL